MSHILAQPGHGIPLGKASLFAGVLAVLTFFGVGFALDGWYFAIGFVAGVAAVVLAVVARRRGTATRADRRMAMAGLLLGGAIAGWFVVYFAVAAVS